jgi:drug/metabolite transporter (DMT)-like permease
MLLATLCFTVMNAFVKAVAHLPALEVVMFRSWISLLLTWGLLWRKQIPYWGNNKRVLLLRGAFGVIALSLFFTTLQHIPLAGAALLQYLAPIFTTILAFWWLGERVYRVQWLLFALCFAGVVVVKYTDARIDWFYLGLGVLSAFFSALAYTCIRKLKNSEHPLVIVFYFPLISVPITTLLVLPLWVWPSGWDWLHLLAIGLLTQVAQTLMTKAYQAEAAAHVSAVNYVGIVYALLLGWIFFGEYIAWGALIGVALVLIGVLLNLSVASWYPPLKKRLWPATKPKPKQTA